MLKAMLKKTGNEGVTMGWERKAFEEMIMLTVEKEREAELLYKSLEKLGIVYNPPNSAFEILMNITGWEHLPDNLEKLQTGEQTREEFLHLFFEQVEKKFSQ